PRRRRHTSFSRAWSSDVCASGLLLAKRGVTGVTAGAFAGMLGGLAGGLTAVFAGARKLHREARDDEERRGVRTYAVSASTLVVAFLATLLLLPQRVPVTIMFVAMFGGVCWLCFAFVPRVTARRKAAELLEDPTAAARHRHERRVALLGGVLGLVLGSAPIVWLWLR